MGEADEEKGSPVAGPAAVAAPGPGSGGKDDAAAAGEPEKPRKPFNNKNYKVGGATTHKACRPGLSPSRPRGRGG